MLSFVKQYANWLHLQWPAGEVENLPKVDDRFRTNIDGVYVVGDLAGVPLLKFSMDGGTRAVRDIVERGGPRVEPDDEEGPYDIVILGAGAAGMAAAREARRQGLSFCVLEARRRFATIRDFQERKPIYTYPNDMTPAGDLQVTAEVKEELVEELEAQTEDIPVRYEEAHRIDETSEGLEVVTTEEERIRAQNVVVAIGRSGNFRSLDVPGEDKEHVHHRVYDPTRCAGEDVLVIGGGDSALEAAIALTEAGANVSLSYRRDEFVRPKPENVERLYGLEQAAKPCLLRVVDPVVMDGRRAQIEKMVELKDYVRLRRLSLQLAADSWIGTPDDVRAFLQAEAADVIHLNMARLGGLSQTIEAILACREQDVAVMLQGSPAESQFAAHVALATQPDLIGATLDQAGGGLSSIVNEMSRTLVWLAARSRS
jgi:thioredoxin reductase